MKHQTINPFFTTITIEVELWILQAQNQNNQYNNKGFDNPKTCYNPVKTFKIVA